MARLNLAPLLGSLKIRTKDRGVVPLAPNWAQRQIIERVQDDYAAGRPSRIIVLKARQIGISTVAEALLFSFAIAFEGTNAVVVAHDASSSEVLFNMTKLYYETWPLRHLFEHRYATRRQLSLDTNGSNIWVMTAGGSNSSGGLRGSAGGRGRTIHALHASECAFWGDPVSTMLAMNQAIPDLPGTLKILESTANGIGNWWENEWNEAVEGRTDYAPFFFPWWQHPEYVRDPRGVRAKGAEERELVQLGCDKQHLAWRRWAIPNLCFGNIDLFHQEYPATAEEAFISSGINAFPEPYLKAVYEPLDAELGRLVKDTSKPGQVRFVSDRAGPLRIFKHPAGDREWGRYFVGADPCQPPGTLVRRVVGDRRHGPLSFEEVPIEQIERGDRLVTFNTAAGGNIRRFGRKVTAAGQRDFSGSLVTVNTGSRSSSYTPEHRCVVRMDAPLTEGNHIVYLARRGDDYRIGRSVWRMEGSGASGFRRRAWRQGADALWILSVHDDPRDAALEEAVLSVRHRVPAWQFESEGQTQAMPLDRFWEKIAQAADCLRACDLDVRYPFWERTRGWQSKSALAIVRAVNLRSGMLVLEPDEVRPGRNGFLKTPRGCGGWTPATVSRSHYDGPVYSLDVEEDHTYVADGIVTHNCYGTLDGDKAAAHVISRRTREQVAVWHGKVNPVSFGDELAALGAYYNDAMVAAEVSGPGMATIGRLVGIYPNLWRHKAADRYPGQNESISVGWSSNWQRKQWMITKLAEVIETGAIIVHDRETFNELRAYSFYGEKGFGDVFGPGVAGGHDDLVMALGITVVCDSSEAEEIPYESREREGSRLIMPEPAEEVAAWD